MKPTRVFWTEPTGRVKRSFRCYGKKADGCSHYYCESMVRLDEVDEERVVSEDGDWHWKGYDAKDFPWEAWKSTCDHCGREIQEPQRQIYCERLFVAKTGELAGQIFTENERPVGAMWDEQWLRGGDGWRKGPADIGYTGRDGIALTIQCPNGPWHVDAEASNCTRSQRIPVEGEPNTTRFVRSHYCWVRLGDPRAGYVHVDKAGDTCAAGAGSIWQNMPDGWHGFCYRGFLIDADDHSMGDVNRMLDAGNPVAPAERAINPVRADMAKVRRTVPARPTAKATPAPGVRRWRSNR